MKKITGGVLSAIMTMALPVSLMMATVPAHAGKNGIVCADFETQAEAQAYFDAKKPGYKRLDRDKDGIACEALK